MYQNRGVFYPTPAVHKATSVRQSQLLELVQKRDVASLNQYLDPSSAKQQPFECIKTGGCYGAGLQFPWHVDSLLSPDDSNKKYLVFWSELTAEDIGALWFEVKGNKLHYIPEDQNLGARIAFNKMAVSFRLPTHEADFHSLTTIDRRSEGLTSLRIGTDYKILSIKQGSKFVPFTQAGGIALFNLPAGTSKLALHYKGVVHWPYYAGDVDNGGVLLSDDYWYPMIARNPAAYSIAATIPSGWKAIGQGNLVSVKLDGEDRVWTYSMPLPVSICSFSAGPFKEVSQVVHGITYHVWSLVDSTAMMKKELQFYPPVIEYYSSVFAKFPFSSYGPVIQPIIGGSALEAYSFATYPSMPGEDPHEPSHTWWGGLISNTYLHSLWNESFADFSVNNFMQHGGIGNQSERETAFIDHPSVSFGHGKYADGTDVPIATGGAFKGPIASYLGYSKGAFVLMQLEQEVGYKKMMACCQRWIKNHDSSHPGEWSGFENAVEEVEGIHFKWFFNQWIDQPGVPDFSISDVKEVDDKLLFHIQFHGKPYRMKANFMLWNSNQTQLKSFEITGKGKSENYSLTIPQGFHHVTFDPYDQLIHKLSSADPRMTIQKALRSFTKLGLGNFAKAFGSLQAIDSVPKDLAGKALIIGSNMSDQKNIQRLFQSVGIKIENNTASWQGTTIDLNQGCAMAIVGSGAERGLIVIGNVSFLPETGDAKLALTDDLGRFLRGKTNFIRSGDWAFKI